MDTMTLNEEDYGDHAVTVGGFSPFTVGHQSVVQQMHRGKHSSVNVFTTRATSRPIPADRKVGYISKAVPANTSVDSTVTPLHALSQMYSQGKRGHVTFYGGSDRAGLIERLKTYNGKKTDHGYYKFDSITFKQVGGERSDQSQGLSGVSGSKARKSKSPDELKSYLPSELHKDATKIFNDINAPKEKKSLRESYLSHDVFNLLDVIKTKEGKQGYIVYRGSNYVTIQLENNITVKSWIYEIEDVKQHVSIFKEEKPDYVIKHNHKNKLPALLIPSKELIESSGQLVYLDYKTKHFDMCPTASKLMKQLFDSKDLNPKYVKQAMMALDKMFGLEKLAETQIPTSTEIHDFTMYASIAHDTFNLLGIQDKDIQFIIDHYKKFAKLIKHHDSSLADEPFAHTVVSHGGELDEAFLQKGRAKAGMFKKITSADYKIKINKRTGKPYKVKNVIIAKGHKKIEDKEEDMSKSVKEGIDKPMGPGIEADKPVGLVSFASFNKIIGRHKLEYTTDAQATEDEKAIVGKKTQHNVQAKKRMQMGLD